MFIIETINLDNTAVGCWKPTGFLEDEDDMIDYVVYMNRVNNRHGIHYRSRPISAIDMGTIKSVDMTTSNTEGGKTLGS